MTVATLLNFLLLTALQFMAGFGLLELARIRLKPGMLLPLAVLVGLGISSLLPFVLQLCYIPLTPFTISVSLALAAWLLNLQVDKRTASLRQHLKNARFRIRLYELPALLLIAFIVFVSVWRCFYFPPTPRDLTSGPEVIAEYAVREKTMINSLFSVNLESTNNPFKPPFITSLQVVYKYAGFAFGQVWLSVIFLCFVIFLYHALCRKLHCLVAGLLLLFFIAIPEMYAYTFMVLFDYSNAVFFCLSLYFLFEFFKGGQRNLLLVSGLLMALASYIRAETLILASMVAITLLVHHLRNKHRLSKLMVSGLIFLFPSVVIYLVSVTMYIRNYLPVDYPVGELLRANLLDPSPFFHRLMAMTEKLMFSDAGVMYFGYFIHIFLALLLVDSVWREKWDTRSLNWLFGVLVVYAGLPFIAFLFPLFDLDHSTKRGLFKIFPLMLMFMANSRFLIFISERIGQWEGGPGGAK